MTKSELLKIAKPILFNTEMIKAILEGRKTATRRCVKPQQIIRLGCDKCPNNMPEEYIAQKKMLFKPWCDMSDNELINAIYKPPYQPGNILYIRETWHRYTKRVGNGEQCRLQKFYGYKASVANSEDADEPWKPSIHMPKEAARIFLKVKDVRVERLQDITEEQAVKEGCQAGFYEYKGAVWGQEDFDEWTAREEFADIWNSIIKKSDLALYGWDANPWVWVIEFERIEPERGV